MKFEDNKYFRLLSVNDNYQHDIKKNAGAVTMC